MDKYIGLILVNKEATGTVHTLSSRDMQFNQATYQLVDDYVRSVGGSTEVTANEGGWAWAELEYVIKVPDLDAEFKVNRFLEHINAMYLTLSNLFSKMETFGEEY